MNEDIEYMHELDAPEYKDVIGADLKWFVWPLADYALDHPNDVVRSAFATREEAENELAYFREHGKPRGA